MERDQAAGADGTHPRLLVLGAGAAQIGLLRAARERGLYVIAVDSDPSAPGFAYADQRALVSSEDEPDVDRLARAENVDGIVSPGADWPVGIAARVAERLLLPHPIDGATAALSTSKQRQRERFAAAGVPQPRLLEEPAAPCVVKAPDRQGQRGLTFVRTDAELPAAIEAALAASRNGDVHRRGVRRRPGGDRQRGVGRRRLPPADGHRPAHRRPARVRGRAGPRVALC